MAIQRYIAHFDLDSFFVSVERLKDPSLVGKPVIVGGHSDRGVVAACSYETRKFGVQSAMPVKKALQLCPQAIIVKGSMADYGRYSNMVTQIIRNKMPVVEKTSIDEFYMDLTGMDRFFGCYTMMTQLKKEIVNSTGLPISCALASNKLISKIATNEAKPNGEIEVLPGTEKAYLHPLKIEKMPMIGKNTADILHRHDILTIGQLAATPSKLLEEILGKHGIDLWFKANGIDDSPVVPYHEQKSISSENTFEKDTTDTAFLELEIGRITERICYELRKLHKLSGCVTIKLRYGNFDTVSKQTTIRHTASDHTIAPVARSLFHALYDTKRPVRLIGVRLSHLIENDKQLPLFEEDDNDPRLYSAIDEVKQRYGMKSIQRAVSVLAKANKQLKGDDPLWIGRNTKEEH